MFTYLRFQCCKNMAKFFQAKMCTYDWSRIGVFQKFLLRQRNSFAGDNTFKNVIFNRRNRSEYDVLRTSFPLSDFKTFLSTYFCTNLYNTLIITLNVRGAGETIPTFRYRNFFVYHLFERCFYGFVRQPLTLESSIGFYFRSILSKIVEGWRDV